MVKTLRPFTEEEKAYVCKFYEIDGPSQMADALDRSYQVIRNLYFRLEKQGKLEYYSNLWDKQFIEIEVKTGSGWF